MRTSGNGDEWLARRAGHVTASRIADVMAKLKNGKPGASRATYMDDVIAERLTGQPTQSFISAAMQHGIDTEPLAVEAYEAQTLTVVKPADFVKHPRIEWSGASPDGYVDDDGLIEVKCPQQTAYVKRLRGGPVPRNYALQVQWQMACTGTKWVDLTYYLAPCQHQSAGGSKLDDSKRMHIERIDRDDDLIADMEQEVETFLAEVSEIIEEISQAQR